MCVCVRAGCVAGQNEKRRASDCTLLRFQTHTLPMPHATSGMHLLHGIGTGGIGGARGALLASAVGRWTQMIAALCGVCAKCHSHSIHLGAVIASALIACNDSDI